MLGVGTGRRRRRERLSSSRRYRNLSTLARTSRIAIIGGGIGGLATARALLLRGFEVTVYEQASRINEIGAGVVMTPNAVKALRCLGLEDAVLARAFAPKAQVARSWRSGRAIDVAPLDTHRDHFGAGFFTGWNAQLLALFDATEHCYKWALYDRDPLPQWCAGRVTLLGDSAHAMLPYLAQGAAQSLEDACVLAANTARTPEDLSGALRRYQDQRIPRTRRIQLGSRARGEANHMPSAWARFRRDARLMLRRRFTPNATT